ncbi:hypothetical protein DVB37_26295 [Achromobacter sp. B7]|uniref:hypothetical protein n=1 Tax=Achromobacter sp. B7 TaxID=2282475 RepID=UPI000E729997|nr:hypothetical protein [Achromobacter sp. B7]AYD67036.1 hypothetical protein DVB37_26295 [Achromobacter sp. B7]
MESLTRNAVSVLMHWLLFKKFQLLHCGNIVREGVENFVRDFDRLDISDERIRLYDSAQKY